MLIPCLFGRGLSNGYDLLFSLIRLGPGFPIRKPMGSIRSKLQPSTATRRYWSSRNSSASIMNTSRN